MTNTSTFGGSAEQAGWHKKPATLYPPVDQALIVDGQRYPFKRRSMNTREALQMIEFQIEFAADLDPELRQAVATLAAALDERERLLEACKLVGPAIDSLLRETHA